MKNIKWAILIYCLMSQVLSVLISKGNKNNAMIGIALLL